MDVTGEKYLNNFVNKWIYPVLKLSLSKAAQDHLTVCYNSLIIDSSNMRKSEVAIAVAPCMGKTEVIDSLIKLLNKEEILADVYESYIQKPVKILVLKDTHLSMFKEDKIVPLISSDYRDKFILNERMNYPFDNSKELKEDYEDMINNFFNCEVEFESDILIKIPDCIYKKLTI